MEENNHTSDLEPGELTMEVVKISAIVFRGNITPPVWYRSILNKNGTANCAAIAILSDLVYWYRASEKRDEQTGRVVSRNRRFKEDFLRRGYADLKIQFGFTPRISELALVILEAMDLAHRIIRPSYVGKLCQPNTMYLRPNPENIALLNDGAYLPGGVYRTNAGVLTVPTPGLEPSQPGSDDNTENTTKSSSEIISLLSAFGVKGFNDNFLKAFEKLDQAKQNEFVARLKSLKVPDGDKLGGFIISGGDLGPETIVSFDQLNKLRAAGGFDPLIAPGQGGEMSGREIVEMLPADHRKGEFPLEKDYYERVQLGARITKLEVTAVMVYYLSETDDGKELYQSYRQMLGCNPGELENVSLMCGSIAAKSTKYQRAAWREQMLNRLLNFMKEELPAERRRIALVNRAAKRKDKTAPSGKVVNDNPSKFNYDENTGFNGK